MPPGGGAGGRGEEQATPDPLDRLRLRLVMSTARAPPENWRALMETFPKTLGNLARALAYTHSHHRSESYASCPH